MPPEPAETVQPLTIHLPAALAQRLKTAALRAHQPAAELVLEILNRNLPRLEDPKKRAPYT
jgi:predicted DNA-binding protein